MRSCGRGVCRRTPTPTGLRRWAALFGLLMSAALPTCGTNDSSPSPQTGSESHFLERCSSSCGEGLSCLCGSCTKECVDRDDCAGLGVGAQCVAVAGQPSAEDAAGSCQCTTCDVSCISTDDCRGLGAGYQCQSGFCRTGAAVCPASALRPGDTERTVLVGGIARSYTVHVPSGYAGTAPVPLVLDFHPMVLGMPFERDNSGYRELSEREGFIVAWPEGIENSWNLGPCCTSEKDIDDLGFARAIVRQLSGDACIDSRRVYAVGYSMGGAMPYYLACTASEVFAAIASSSMDMFVDSDVACQPSRPVAEISFRDTADKVVPYEGGISHPPGRTDLSANLLGAVGTFQRWAELDECTSPPSEPDSRGCSTYSQCRGGVEVTLCTSSEGLQVMGNAELTWEMLKRYPMP